MMLASAQAMDIAGIDRVVVSDHVVFGENPDAYAVPSVGGAADLTAIIVVYRCENKYSLFRERLFAYDSAVVVGRVGREWLGAKPQ